MRAFIGIKATEEVHAALTDAQRRLAASRAQVKWVEAANIHLTLKFLGEIDETTAERVRAAMASACGAGAFSYAVSGLGSFPPRRAPRVIWAGVTAGAEQAIALQDRLEAQLAPLGFEKERAFVPHLTIGRVKAPRGAEELLPLIEQYAGAAFGVCPADEMILFRSELTPRGSVYSCVAKQPL